MKLINKTHLRKHILQTITDVRPSLEFDRVSQRAIDWYEATLRAMIRRDIEHHPSRGKTFCDLITKEATNA